MQFFGLRVLIKRIKAIRFMMADRSVPKRKKGSCHSRYNIPFPADRSHSADTFSDRVDGRSGAVAVHTVVSQRRAGQVLERRENI